MGKGGSNAHKGMGKGGHTHKGMGNRGSHAHKGMGKGGRTHTKEWGRGVTCTQGNGEGGSHAQGNGEIGVTRTQGNGEGGVARTHTHTLSQLEGLHNCTQSLTAPLHTSPDVDLHSESRVPKTSFPPFLSCRQISHRRWAFVACFVSVSFRRKYTTGLWRAVVCAV